MNNEQPQGFPERWVWAACAHIYGAPIRPNTWYKYKKICKAPDFRAARGKEHLISKTHCQWLMMLAFIRSEQRRANGKPPVGRGAGVELTEIIKRLNSNPVLKQQLDKALGDAILVDGIKGHEVPHWLSRQVGRCPSIPTLRRWAKKYGVKFSLQKPVPHETLNIFLQIA